MKIGIPKELKDNENRAGMVPAGVHVLVQKGHQVFVEKSAGAGSGIQDSEYLEAGAEILESADDLWDCADLILKVKEPLKAEYSRCRESQVVFTYFHFAANRELTEAMMNSGATCVAYETIEDRQGRLPLLTPMSEVAGRMAIQQGAKYLEKPMMGRGILLGGVPGVAPAEVTIIGGGVVGTNAAKVAAGLGAHVTILDIDLDRLRYLDDIMPPNVTTLVSNPYNIRYQVQQADLLIGAVLVSGARAPILVPDAFVSEMKPGAVVVDVAVDQGGCIETCRPTTHSEPTYMKHDVVHYCVANMPGAVGRTSTYALTNATTPYVVEIADQGIVQAAKNNVHIEQGINIHSGKITIRGISEAFDLPYHEAKELL
ncbi:MAG: alanine dehydrogenase [Planctomycetota bacterium]|jgi:alanine dehydrogenase|nr:alanine dehydrogenase [Planctomycetota bacterium]